MIVAAISHVFLLNSAKEEDVYLCDWLLLYPFLTDFSENDCKRNYFQIVVIRAA